MLVSLGRPYLLTALTIVFLTAWAWRAGATPSPRPLPARPVARLQPWRLSPPAIDLAVVSDSQLQAVLARLRPLKSCRNTNNLLHALRLWGQSADFASPAFWTGRDLRDHFLSHAQFSQTTGPEALPLVEQTSRGPRVRLWHRDDPQHDFAAAHENDLLATLAEIGLPSDTPLHVPGETTNISELYRAAAERYHSQQLEPEWTLISYARWSYPQVGWQNQYGEHITASQLMEQAFQAPPGHGVCAGTHRLEGLVLLLNLQRMQPAAGCFSAKRLERYLIAQRNLVLAAQHPHGYWARNWGGGAAAQNASTADLAGQILATGHHLEWLALLPSELRPPREPVLRAAQWLVQALERVEEGQLEALYGPFSHAGRALCLWRGTEAWPRWQTFAQLPVAGNDP